jgi:hypothetical protein
MLDVISHVSTAPYAAVVATDLSGNLICTYSAVATGESVQGVHLLPDGLCSQFSLRCRRSILYFPLTAVRDSQIAWDERRSVYEAEGIGGAIGVPAGR